MRARSVGAAPAASPLVFVLAPSAAVAPPASDAVAAAENGGQFDTDAGSVTAVPQPDPK